MKRNPYKKGEGVTVQASMNKFWVDKLERGKNIEAYNQFLLTPIPVAPGMKVQKSNLFTMGFSKTKRKKIAVPTVGEPGSSSTLVTPKPVSSGCTNKVLGDAAEVLPDSFTGSRISIVQAVNDILDVLPVFAVCHLGGNIILVDVHNVSTTRATCLNSWCLKR